MHRIIGGAALVLVFGCAVPPPQPPPVTTDDGQACVQRCQVIHAWCMAGANQAAASPAGGTEGAVLIGVIASGFMQHSAAKSCASNLATCYGGCRDPSGGPARLAAAWVLASSQDPSAPVE